jgi:dTDP-glucose 4,6-dehydratase
LRVAVLGSNSFAGGDFIDLLLGAGRDEVLGISRSPEKPPASRAYGERPRDRFVYRQLDLNRDLAEIAAALDAFRPDFVVNFAAQGELAASWAHPQDYFRTNCAALAALVDALSRRSYVQRFLHLSTSSVYASSGPAHTEESPPAPGTPYGVSKAAFDQLLLAYHRSSGFPAQIVRPPNLYGPYQQPFRIVPKSAITLKLGRPIDLHGGGRAPKQYLHVRDASHAILAVLERGATGQTYNVAPRELSSVREIVALVCERLGKDFGTCTREVEDRREQQAGLVIDATKIARELGWAARVPLRSGIEGVVDWVEREWDDLSGRPLVYVHRP